MSDQNLSYVYRCFEYSEVPFGENRGIEYFIADDNNLYLAKMNIYMKDDNLENYTAVKKANSFDDKYRLFIRTVSLTTYGDNDLVLCIGSDKYQLKIDKHTHSVKNDYESTDLLFRNSNVGSMFCRSEGSIISIRLTEAMLRERILLDSY